jgi:hypothetical protein
LTPTTTWRRLDRLGELVGRPLDLGLLEALLDRRTAPPISSILVEVGRASASIWSVSDSIT